MYPNMCPFYVSRYMDIAFVVCYAKVRGFGSFLISRKGKEGD